MAAEQLPELLKTMLFIKNTSGTIYRDVCLQIDGLVAYRETTAVNDGKTS